MPRGGKRVAGEGKSIGRPKNQPQSVNLPKKNLAAEIRASLGGQFRNHPDDCNCEGCLWKKDAEQFGAAGRPARAILWDRDEGKTVQPVDHNPNDKPVEINVRIHRVGAKS